MKSIFFYTSAIGFAAGIALASLCSYALALGLASAVISLSVSLVSICFSKAGVPTPHQGPEVERIHYGVNLAPVRDSAPTAALREAPSYYLGNVIKTIILFFSFAFLGVVYLIGVEYLNRPDETLSSYKDKSVTLMGIISGEVDRRVDKQRFVTKVHEIRVQDTSVEIDDKVIISTDLYPVYKYGDEVNITGAIKAQEDFKDEFGRVFRYRNYLTKEGVHFEMMNPKIKMGSSGNGFFLKSTMLSVKNYFSERIKELIPDPHASLVNGVLLGEKQSLGKEILDMFRVAGIIHIIVLSGYNITIVAEYFMKLAFFLSRAKRLLAGSLAVILFVIMVGASSTVIRAASMALIAVSAKLFYRRYSAIRALVIAGLVMILINPFILVDDPSFQLSFIATLGLIFGVPIMERLLRRLPNIFKLREILATTIATQIFVLPLLLVLTGRLSTVGIVVNALVLPVVPIIMLMGFLSVIAGIFGSLVAAPFGYATYFLIEYLFKVSDFFSNIPYASVYLEPSLFIIFIMYVFLGLFTFIFWKKRIMNSFVM